MHVYDQREGYNVNIMDLFGSKSIGLRAALEDYITTGEGDVTEILEGKKHFALFEKHAIK